MSPILQTNELPIREIKICVGCNNVDEYAQCSYIQTPKSKIAESYGLLRSSQILLFEMMKLNDIEGVAKTKKIVRELIEIIKFYEKHL